MDFWVTIIVRGLSFSVLLFMLSSGLSLIFGLMNVLNLTHGGYYLIGSFVGISIYKWTGNFLLAILAGGVAAGIIRVGMERACLRYLPGHLLDQVILTMGFWGPLPQMAAPPSPLQVPCKLGHIPFIFITFSLSLLDSS